MKDIKYIYKIRTKSRLYRRDIKDSKYKVNDYHVLFNLKFLAVNTYSSCIIYIPIQFYNIKNCMYNSRIKTCIITKKNISLNDDYLYFININEFIRKFKEQKNDINFQNRIKMTRYILNDITWEEFVEVMRNNNIYITGGKNRDNHILTMLHYKTFMFYNNVKSGLNEQLEVSDSRTENMSTLGTITLLFRGIMDKKLSCQNKFVSTRIRLAKIHKHPLTLVFILSSIIGLIFMFLFPSFLSVLPLDYFHNLMYKFYLDPKRIIFGDPIMTSGLPDELDEKVLNDGEVHEEYDRKIYSPENKQDLLWKVELVRNVINKGSELLSIFGVTVAGSNYNNRVVRNMSLLGTLGSVIIGQVGDILCKRWERNIKNIPDNYYVENEPKSLSEDNDNIANTSTNIVKNITEENSSESGSSSLESIDNIFNSSMEIPFLTEMLEYFNNLDDEYKLAIYSVILIIIAIYLQLMKIFKNNINKSINKLPIDNKYFESFIQYKNIMNRFSNIYVDFLTGLFIFVAFLCILSLIF